MVRHAIQPHRATSHQPPCGKQAAHAEAPEADVHFQRESSRYWPLPFKRARGATHAQATWVLRAQHPGKVMLILCVLTLFIRGAFLVLMTSNNAVEIQDAQAYFRRAVGFAHILSGLLSGQMPASRDLAVAYSSTWPPMQSFVLSLGLVVFGDNLFAGRVTMIVLATMTTPLVYLVTRKLSNERAARFASIIFAIYPSFVHFSLRLFSETTCIFLLFLALYCIVQAVKASRYKKVAILAALTGVILGLGTLTRAASILWVPTAALWTGWHATAPKKPFLITLIVLSFAGLVLLPWEATLFTTEGKVLMITDSGDPSFYMDITPEAVNDQPISTMTVDQQQTSVLTAIFQEWRNTWMPDFALYKYMATLGYPPMSAFWFNVIIGITFISFIFFLVLALWGLLNPLPALRCRMLIVALLAVTMATYITTHGQPRFSIPLLALLLPAAGHGAAHMGAFTKKASRRWAVLTVAGMAFVLISMYSGLLYQFGKTSPSSHYTPFVQQLDRWLGFKITVSDKLLFRITGDQHPQEIQLSVADSNFVFADTQKQTYVWKPGIEPDLLTVIVRSQSPTTPLRIHITSPGSSGIIQLHRDAWRTWQPFGSSGLEYLWAGSADMKFP